MADKIKLLFYTELWANAGIESVIMNLFRNFDLSKISVDIMASQDKSNFYDEEIAALGGRKIITLSENYDSPTKRMLANRSEFENIIKSNHYDIVHLHMCNAAAMIYGEIAKKNGINVVAYHSHNTNLGTSHRFIKTIYHNISKLRYEKYGDVFLSCSDLASKWLFSPKAIRDNKVTIINNAINLEKFSYSEQMRIEYRKKLNFGEKFVVGHIGRFAVAKNHSFLVDIFESIHKQVKESLLLLVGDGEDEIMIRNKVQQLGLNDSVIFYGTTNEIPQLLWSMDAFVLPSYFEGNPLVGIEAQAAGLPCFFSDGITRMCKLTSSVEYIPLSTSSEEWSKIILCAKGKKRARTTEQMREAGYDINSVSKKIQEIYLSALLQSN